MSCFFQQPSPHRIALEAAFPASSRPPHPVHPPTMPFQVTEITTFDDWQTIQASMEDGLAEPYFPYWQLIKGPSDDDRVTRYWNIHQATPGSHWIKASDPGTGEVVGAANWIINETSPFESLLIVPRASWWPEGVQSSYSSLIMDHLVNQLLSSRSPRP